MDKKQGKVSKTTTILLALIVVLTLCALAAGMTAGRRMAVSSAAAKTPKITNEQVMQACMDALEPSFPGRLSCEWDKDKYIFTVFVGDPDIKTVGLSAKAGDQKSLESWAKLCTLFTELSASMQQKFIEAGYGTSVAVCAADPANHDTVYIMANNGKLLYDAVA